MKLASPQRRLKPRTPLHRAPQYRLEPQRLVAFQHGLEASEYDRSRSLKPTRRQRYRAPRRWQQRQHNTDPSNNSASAPAGYSWTRKSSTSRLPKLHQLQATSTSTSAMPIMGRVISAVIAPLARSRETLMDDAVGGYRGRRACEARINTAMGWLSCYSE